MLTLVPAFGRDYKSGKSVQADWDANKDFIIQDISSTWDGRACNKEDIKNEGKYTSVKIRYDQLRKIKVIQL
jgi:hypothetical protein